MKEFMSFGKMFLKEAKVGKFPVRISRDPGIYQNRLIFQTLLRSSYSWTIIYDTTASCLLANLARTSKKKLLFLNHALSIDFW